MSGLTVNLVSHECSFKTSIRTFIDLDHIGRVRVGVRWNSREIEICDDEEECCACDEDIVVVLQGGQCLLNAVVG